MRPLSQQCQHPQIRLRVSTDKPSTDRCTQEWFGVQAKGFAVQAKGLQSDHSARRTKTPHPKNTSENIRCTFQNVQLHEIGSGWFGDVGKAVQGGLVQSVGGKRAACNQLSVG